MESVQPLISAVLPTRNRAEFLEPVLKSLIEEKHRCYPNMEIIVVDGGSTDRTLEILEKYRHELAHVISEKDRGVGEAFTKGIQRAKGDYIRYVADDDRLVPGVTQRMMKLMLEHTEVDIVGGRIQAFVAKADGRLEPVENPVPCGDATLARVAAPWEHGFVFPEACLFRKKVFFTVGFWDDSAWPVADYDFFLKALKQGRKIFISNEVFLNKYWHNDSTIFKSGIQANHRTLQLIFKYAGVFAAWRYAKAVLIPIWKRKLRRNTAASLLRKAGTYFQSLFKKIANLKS